VTALPHPEADDIKAFPRYQREDARWGRTKSIALIRQGHLEVVQILGRKYVKMASHRRLIATGTK
jgi:hypothetical protein